jgi:hypothetical protein
MKSRNMRWAVGISHVWGINASCVWRGDLKERNYCEDLWERIIFRWILKIKYGWCGLDSSGSRKGQVLV